MNGEHDKYKGDTVLSIQLAFFHGIILQRYDILKSFVKDFVTENLLTVFVSREKSS